MLKESNDQSNAADPKIFKHSENGVFYFRVADNKSMGIGVALTEGLALKKAIFEKIEREYSRVYATSNGCSAHTSVTAAEEHSYHETIERYLFLRHWVTKTSGFSIPKFSLRFLVPDNLFAVVARKCQQNRLSYSVKLLGCHNRRYYVSGVVYGISDNVGALFSSNNGETLREAFSNLFLDFTRSLWMIESNMNDYASRWKGLPKDVATRDDHFFFFLKSQ